MNSEISESNHLIRVLISSKVSVLKRKHSGNQARHFLRQFQNDPEDLIVRDFTA